MAHSSSVSKCARHVHLDERPRRTVLWSAMTARKRPARYGGMVRGSNARAARDARIGWNQAIDVWEDFEERGLDYSRDVVHGPALLRAIGPVRGLRVLDVGCGQGRFTRELEKRGARVSAIDWSPAMISSALRHERMSPSGIDFRVRDARSVGRAWPAGTFDVVVACMSFMDMPGLPRVLRGSHRLLRSRGRLVFSISHPLNTAAIPWERPASKQPGGMVVSRYFEERVGITEWRMARLKRPFDTTFWHRTLETWFLLLSQTGFTFESLAEPRATPTQARKNALLRGTRDFPFFLVISARK